MLKTSNPKLVISCASPNQFPETTLTEVVFVGKSNVGKSTLINGLTNRKSLAYVGKTPGKTRLVNFYQINDDLMLVDVPGYGYAKRSVEEQVKYGDLMESYFSSRPQLKAMVIVMDVRRDFGEDDQMMLDLAKQNKLGVCIAISKKNKVSYSKVLAVKNKIQNITKVPVFSFDTGDTMGFDEISYQIEGWL